MKLTVLKNQVPINQFEFQIDSLDEIYEIYVGRSEDCHVIIDDPLISRHHFLIKNQGSAWIIEKLTNLGVISINGSFIEKNQIQGGEEIKFGAYSIFIQDLPTVIQETNDLSENQNVFQPQMSQPDLSSIQKNLAAADDLPLIDSMSAEEEIQAEDNSFDDKALESVENAESIDDFKDSSEVGLSFDDNSLSDLNTEESVVSERNNFESTDENSLNDGQDFSSGDSNDEMMSGMSIEEGFGGEEQNEGTRVFQTFLKFHLVLFGENIPYDRFSIEDEEIFIGRDKNKCQITLDDSEVSSVHAVLRKSGNDFFLEDLNSSNGTILNGERINKAQLHSGDDFIIGSTTFTLEVKSDLLESESDRLMPVEAGQVVETEEIVEEEISIGEDEDITFNSEAPLEKSIIKRIWKDPVKRKKTIYAVGLIVFIWVMFGEDDPNIEAPQTNEKKEAKTENKKGNKKALDSKKPAIVLSPDQQNKVNVAYELGVSFFEQAKYFEAHREFEIVVSMNPEHKKVQSYLEQTKEALKRIEELDKEKREEAERIEKKKKIEEILVKARDAVKERQVKLAESLFSQVIALDPENLEISQLKLDLDSWQKEQERIALEKAAAIAARKKMVDQLAPGKASYLKKEWYKAILRLEEFLLIKGVDEDLVKEGSDMLSDAKNQLASEVGPALGKARSLKEGQDLKNAYEAYLEVLVIEPTNREALNEVDDIKMELELRSRKIYREAIISESLSLFNDAKEKFQEVQQISPTDSEYYKKAKNKLKNYLE